MASTNAASTGYAGYFSQSGTGAAYGIYVTEGGASNTGYGIYANNASTGGYAVYASGALKTTGTATAAYFIPTSSTVPSNGMYLSGANTLDFATSGAKALEINSSGAITTGVWNGTVITVTYGGTGAASFTQSGVLYGNGTSAIGVTATGASGYLLTSAGGSAPAWSQINLGTSARPSQARWSGDQWRSRRYEHRQRIHSATSRAPRR